MRTKIFSGLYGENSAVINDNNLSFEEVLDLYMRNVQPLSKAPSNAAVLHIHPQASDKEIKLFQQNKKSIFNRIVHLEQFEDDIALVNRDTKMKYSFPKHYDPHVVHKTEQSDAYFGDKGYTELVEGGIPTDYGKFYNRKTKKQVAKIFADDLRIYNYTFPFDKLY
jgi:hypothetical protein